MNSTVIDTFVFFHYVEPVVTLTSLRVGCGYVYVSWTTVNREICRIVYSAVQLRNSGYSYTSISFDTYNKFTKVPSNALLTVNIYVSAIYILSYGDSVVPDYSTSVRTKFMESMYIYRLHTHCI